MKRVILCAAALLLCLSACARSVPSAPPETQPAGSTASGTLPYIGPVIGPSSAAKAESESAAETQPGTEETQPVFTEPAPPEPPTEVPVWTEPVITEPEPAEPAPAEPETTEPEPTEGEAAKPLRIFCYGDSNTYGLTPDFGRLPEEDIWPNVLASLLGARAEVRSDGLTGRTTAYDRPGAAWKNGLTALPDALAENCPVDILIFFLGGNDCLAEMQLEVPDIAAGMEQLIVEAKLRCLSLQGHTPKILLITPPGFPPEYVNSLSVYELDDASVTKSHEMGPYYEKLAKKYGCLYYDATDRLELDDADCEHMTVQGHRQLAEALYSILDPVIP